jgi:hypothetical protein
MISLNIYIQEFSVVVSEEFFTETIDLLFYLYLEMIKVESQRNEISLLWVIF